MKKMLLTMLLITGLFAQSDLTLVGGINYSTFGGSDNELADIKPDNLLDKLSDIKISIPEIRCIIE